MNWQSSEILVTKNWILSQVFSRILSKFPKHLFYRIMSLSTSFIYVVLFCYYWSALRWHKHMFLLSSNVSYFLLFELVKIYNKLKTNFHSVVILRVHMFLFAKVLMLSVTSIYFCFWFFIFLRKLQWHCQKVV